ncbi:hypothetical protein F442_06548 [Phytophthora nicotianae P10297]|uniref:MULE transposase domain-containing protein n=1 Tax=Phytophthora nicotianae P10297 TaxID=1317064 RepID=W2ZK29_PHYNI|nr:hypothetical protein F442_06548 [Phytophthora nicotianae P10297]
MLGYAAKYVLQIDTTYKLDQSGYPVLVIGFSDQSQSFDPLVMFVTFQQTGDLISIARQSVFDVFKGITGDYPDIRYCVAGADKAQYNVVMDTTSSKRSHNSNGALTYLMCFFHVVKNVADRVSSFPMENGRRIQYLTALRHTSRNNGLILLSATGVVTTPTGFATTNNPVEQFSNAIKKDYSQEH